MKPELKQAWIEALRSGKYEQGTGLLKRDYSHMNTEAGATYCCLGVLLEVASEKGILEVEFCKDLPESSGTSAKVFFENDYYAHLRGEYTFDVRERLELTYEQEAELISMNDTQRKSFLQIAEWIEENL